MKGRRHNLVMFFRLGKSIIYDLFRCSADVMNKRISFREPPLGDEEALPAISDGFEHSRVAPSPLWSCASALDGISINIKKPRDKYYPRIYYSRKGFIQSLLKQLSILPTVSCIPLHYA